jgi:ferric-dicitrate binding protein FerR (iron transport regulator)
MKPETDYLFDKSGEDPQVAELEGLLRVYAHRAPLREPAALGEPAPRRRWRAAAAASGLVALAIVLVVLWRGNASDACRDGGGFAFTVEGGPARCGGGVIARGSLPVGAWLETSSGAIADVRVADIGKLTVYGDSRVRLVGTGAAGHHMELARGKLAARVTAPPRLFVIDTPVAAAVDLGCAYELAVDDDGRTTLRVTSGVVSLEGHGRLAYAPMGTEVLAVPGRGPGTPVAIAAPAALRDAVARFDAGDASALAGIVERAQLPDVFTLWNLLSRTTGDARATVVTRLDQLSHLPDGVRAEDVRAGDPAALERWRDALDDYWLCPECERTK